MDEPHPSVAHLPAAFFDAAPELRSKLPVEHRATCDDCAMAGVFLAQVRCCTYHPTLPNFLVGRALQREDVGSEAIRARLKDADGVSRMGIAPSNTWLQDYRRRAPEVFGRDARWTCPYWRPGKLGCSIWRDRGAVCRSWHCKFVDGHAGHQAWVCFRRLGAHLQKLAATRAAAEVELVDDDWEAFFVATAAYVDTLERLPDDPTTSQLRSELQAALEGIEAPMHDVLAPLVRGVVDHDDGMVELEGYSPWDTERFPRAVFTLLAAFDGERTWQQALEQARASAPEIDESWVRRLYRIDALHPKDQPDIWGFEGRDLDPNELFGTS